MRTIYKICSCKLRCFHTITNEPRVHYVLAHKRAVHIDKGTVAQNFRFQAAVICGNTIREQNTLLRTVLIIHRVVVVLCKERNFGHVLTREVEGYVVVQIIIAFKRHIGLTDEISSVRAGQIRALENRTRF